MFKLSGAIISYILLCHSSGTGAFTTSTSMRKTAIVGLQNNNKIIQKSKTTTTTALSLSADEDEETRKLLEKAAQLRAEIASLEGKSVEQVAEEAKTKKLQDKERIEQAKARAAVAEELSSKELLDKRLEDDGKFLYVPENEEEIIRQASSAIERAFKDGINRQSVRLPLIKEGEQISSSNVEEWPGGAKQMFRESGKPLSMSLLKEVRAVPSSSSTGKSENEKDEKDATASRVNQFLPPVVKCQDIWDFDGSALITAEAAGGAEGDVQAYVFPNTDVKYLKDIKEIDSHMKNRLFLLINPFWRNVESWGFNILAPNAKKMAQDIIFDVDAKGVGNGNYQETYVVNRFSARGEQCVSLKVYPYDWQMFAYKEDDYYPMIETAVRLGSSKEEPTSSMFTDLLNEREEFKYSRNMRQIKKNFE